MNERDLVLKKRNQALPDPRGRFAPNYKGPYVVERAFSRGALILVDMEEGEIQMPMNSNNVIKYYA